MTDKEQMLCEAFDIFKQLVELREYAESIGEKEIGKDADKAVSFVGDIITKLY